MEVIADLWRMARRALPWAMLIGGVVWFSKGRIGGSGHFPVGGHLPALTTQLVDGTQFSLADLHGQVLVLNFWATWCPPCRAETPVLSAAHERGVRVVGLSVEDRSEHVLGVARELGIRYPIGFADKPISASFHLDLVPTTYVLSPSGEIVLSRSGAITQSELDAAVEKAKPRG